MVSEEELKRQQEMDLRSYIDHVWYKADRERKQGRKGGRFVWDGMQGIGFNTLQIDDDKWRKIMDNDEFIDSLYKLASLFEGIMDEVDIFYGYDA